MKDQSKTKQVLIQELAALKQRITELEQAESDYKRLEDDLTKEREKLKTTWNNAPFGMVLINKDGDFTYINSKFTDMFGYDSSDVPDGRTWFRTAYPAAEYRHTIISAWLEDLADAEPGERKPRNFTVTCKDRTEKIVDFISSKLISGDYLMTCKDITLNKKAEEEVRQSEELYRTLVETSPDAILIYALDGTILAVNSQLVRTYGAASAAEFHAEIKTVFDLISEYERSSAAANFRRMMSQEGSRKSEYRVRLRDGQYISVEINSSIVMTADGKPKAFISVVRDITQRKLVEEALRKGEERFRSLIQSLSDMVFIIDKSGQITYESPSVSRILGYQPGHFIGKSPFTHIHPDDLDQVAKDLDEVVQAVNPGLPTEFRYQKADNTWVNLEALGNNHYDNLEIQGVVITARDITERKRAEEKYRAIFDNAMEGIYQSTSDGRLISVNPALARIFGYDSPEAMMNEVTSIGRSLYADPSQRQVFLRFIEEKGAAKNFEFEGSKRDGERIYISDTARAVRDRNNKTLYYEGIIQDITERKRAEDALRESEERFRALSENAPDIIYTMNPLGAITYANPSWQRILGHDKEELLGRYFTDFARKEDRNAYKKLFKTIRDDGKIVSNYIGVMLTKGGKERVFNMNSAFNRNSKGHIIGVVGTMADVTEQREVGKKLQEAQKLEAIGTLAGGIAHDFNNLLMGIQGYASMTLLDLDPSHPHYERLKRIEEQVQSGSDLTKQLLGFARGGRYEVRPTDMNEIIERTSSMFGRTKKEIALHRSLGQDLWMVDCDQGQMEQVLMNLYVNAWQAMPGGGDLSLETANALLGDDNALPHTIKPGRYVKVSITDTGTGMDEEIRGRIFDPFFTTKTMGRGTGLGLAMVYGIVKGHGGMIDVTSELGQGTTFNIYLPATEKPIFEKQAAPRQILRGTETILLVDDEPFVLEVTRDLLESLGYRIYAVGSGQEAIAVYLEKRKEIDLVILDMIMPGISGGDTFDRLREIDPDIRVLLSSGYSIKGQAQQILERGCNGFLQKPFHLEMLSRKVRELLSA